MKFSARFIFSLFLIPYSLFLLTSPTFAQTNEPIPQNTHNYVQTVMIDTMAAMTCQLTGIDPAGGGKKCLGYDQKTGEIGFVQNGNGAVGAMGGLIAVLYNPPLSSGDYFQYLARNFGIAKPVYAEGKSGFDGLKPLLPVWTVFRNLVYVLFAVAFVLVGLAIMLRVRIDPRTVMTIQNQIPKLIIALLLVTFSYAIAGFLVDLMYVTIYLLFGIVAGIKIPGVSQLSPAAQNFQGLDPINYFNSLPQGGIGGITMNIAGGVKDMLQNTIFAGPIGGFLSGVIAGAIGLGVAGIGGQAAGIGAGIGAGICALTGAGLAATPICAAVGSLLAAIATGVITGLTTGNALVGGVAAIVAFLIIGIAVLWSLFRLWFQLIMAYVMLLIDVVFAPFWVLLGVLPGAPIGFGAWLRSILSNLSPFPVTIGMFLLAKIFMESFQHVANTAGGTAFMPPLIGNPGTNTYGALASFIGLGFILLTPQVVAMTKDFLKAPAFKYMPAIGQAIGVGPAVTGGLVGAIASPFGALAMFKTFKKEIGAGGQAIQALRQRLSTTQVGTKTQEDTGGG